MVAGRKQGWVPFPGTVYFDRLAHLVRALGAQGAGGASAHAAFESD